MFLTATKMRQVVGWLPCCVYTHDTISGENLRSKNHLGQHERWLGPEATLKIDHHHQSYSYRGSCHQITHYISRLWHYLAFMFWCAKADIHSFNSHDWGNHFCTIFMSDLSIRWLIYRQFDVMAKLFLLPLWSLHWRVFQILKKISTLVIIFLSERDIKYYLLIA